MNVDRRAFLIATAGITLAGCRSAQPPAAPTPAPQPIIDTHQHIWDLTRLRLPWLDHASPRLNRTYTPDDYAAATEGLDVVKAVYAEVDVAPDGRQAEADYIVELCRSRSTPTAAAVLGAKVRDAAFPAYIKQYKDSPYVKGVRDPLVRGVADDPRFLAGVRLLGELGMSFDLNMGNDLLGDAARVVAACPGTRFVLDHCGNPSVKWFAAAAAGDEKLRQRRAAWEQDVARLADLPNVLCKISGIVESGDDGRVTVADVAPPVNYCLDRFGEGRVIFAGNWPVCLMTTPLASWVDMLKQVTAGRGEAFNRRLFHDNAAAFYRL